MLIKQLLPKYSTLLQKMRLLVQRTIFGRVRHLLACCGRWCFRAEVHIGELNRNGHLPVTFIHCSFVVFGVFWDSTARGAEHEAWVLSHFCLFADKLRKEGKRKEGYAMVLFIPGTLKNPRFLKTWRQLFHNGGHPSGGIQVAEPGEVRVSFRTLVPALGLPAPAACACPCPSAWESFRSF